MSVQLFGLSQFVLTNTATHRINHMSKEFLPTGSKLSPRLQMTIPHESLLV